MNQLERIVARTREEVARRILTVPVAELERVGAQRADAGDRRSFMSVLSRPGLSLIAEHKRRSPSAGLIREGIALEEVVQAYTRGGAAALSILTEHSSFGGSLEDLRAARAASGLPILRKDFIVDRYQVQESFAAGADAILLIVAALSPRSLSELHAQALELGMAALVEVHDQQELAVALAARGRSWSASTTATWARWRSTPPDVRAPTAASGGGDRGRGIRLSPGAGARRARGGRGRRRARRRGPDAVCRHRGRRAVP